MKYPTTIVKGVAEMWWFSGWQTAEFIRNFSPEMMNAAGFRSGVKEYHLYTMIFAVILSLAAVLAAISPLFPSTAQEELSGISYTTGYTADVKLAILYHFLAAACCKRNNRKTG